MYNFDYLKALYRRNNFGQPTMWLAEIIGPCTIKLKHGIVGKTITEELIGINRKPEDEIKSRYNAKRKTGYKLLAELKDNVALPVEGELLHYLNAYLPTYRTTADGSLLPMLAKVYDNENNKLFAKNGKYIGQYKINGLRCFISAIAVKDIFNPIKLQFQSREGTYWNSLVHLEEYLLEVIPKELLERMIEEHYILDGELYLPGHSVNEINHFIKDPNCTENRYIQYWCYDLAVDNINQEDRLELLDRYLHFVIKRFTTREEHLSNKTRLVLLPNHDYITSGDVAAALRDSYINRGFEGLILRKADAEYQYGKRNLSMIKYKKSTDGKFKIIDIYPEGNKRSNIPLVLLKNDINDETFEVHVGGSVDYQESILKYKDKFIGRYMFVEYGERSGVKQVPFHVKQTYII